MSYSQDTWYNELYRIFSEDTLLNIHQVRQLGKCLLAIQNHENATEELNNLYYSVRQLKPLAESLDRYIHAYIKYQEEENNDAEDEQDNEESKDTEYRYPYYED